MKPPTFQDFENAFEDFYKDTRKETNSKTFSEFMKVYEALNKTQLTTDQEELMNEYLALADTMPFPTDKKEQLLAKTKKTAQNIVDIRTKMVNSFHEKYEQTQKISTGDIKANKEKLSLKKNQLIDLLNRYVFYLGVYLQSQQDIISDFGALIYYLNKQDVGQAQKLMKDIIPQINRWVFKSDSAKEFLEKYKSFQPSTPAPTPAPALAAAKSLQDALESLKNSLIMLKSQLK
jgi:small-conductance mechanosensitive channel